MPRRATNSSIIPVSEIGEEHYIYLQLREHADSERTSLEDPPLESNDNQRRSGDSNETSSSPPCHSPISGYQLISRQHHLLLLACGCVSIVIGCLGFLFGVLELVNESKPLDGGSRTSRPVRGRFSMLMLLLSGYAALKTIKKDPGKPKKVICLLAFSLLGAGTCFCDFMMEILSWHYAYGSTARAIGASALGLCLVGGFASVIQICIALCISSSTDENNQCDDYFARFSWWKRYAIMAVGMTQLGLGMTASGIILASYKVLQTNDIANISSGKGGGHILQEVKWTFSSDLIGHGWLISAAGFSLAVTATRMTRCRQFAALALQAATLLTTVQNCVHPFADLYVNNWENAKEAKLTTALLINYIFVIVLCTVATIQLIRMIDHDAAICLNLRFYVEKRGWGLYKRTTIIQFLLAISYVGISLICFTEKYLYLLDFTPLPLLVFLHSILSYALTSTYSAHLLLLNVVSAFLCGLFSLRDLYLFDYHMAITEPADRLEWSNNNSTTSQKVPKIFQGGLHLLLAAVALMEAVLSILLILMYLRTFADVVSRVQRLKFKRSLIFVISTGVLQLIAGLLLVNFALVLFLSNQFAVQYSGDSCAFLGILLIAAGSFSFLSSRRNQSSVILPMAASMNLLAFFIMWHHTDSEGLLLSSMIAYDQSDPDNDYHRSFFISTISFSLLIFCQLLTGFSLVIFEDILES